MATALADLGIMDNLNPGLLDLHLTINNRKLTYDQSAQAKRKLNRRLPQLARELVDRPIRHAVRNYVGLLYFRTGEKDKAIQCWENTLEGDPVNLNAIQDLSTGYAKLGDHRKSGEWQERLEDVRSRLSGSPDEERMVCARCLAEQAFASCWDIHTDTWNGVERMTKKVELYKSALEKHAGSLISNEEKEDWCLGIGQAFERLSHMCFRSGESKHEKYLECIDEAVKYLDISLTSDNVFCQVEAWGVMGNALTRDIKFVPKCGIPHFVKTKYRAQWHKPALCYDKALSLDPRNSWILGRYGHLHFKQRRYCEALRVLNESIKYDEASTWFSRDVRARVCKSLAHETSDQDFKRQFLKQADEDAIIAGSYNPNPRTFSCRGEINHGLANCAETEEEKRYRSLKALGQFSESFEIQNGESISDAHFKLASCLLKHDRWSAIQSWKMAYSTSSSEGFSHAIAENVLLPNMLCEYRSQNHPENLRAELATWIMDASSKSSPDLFAIIGRLAAKKRFPNEVLDAMEYIVDNVHHLEGTHCIIESGFKELRQTKYWYADYQRLCNLESKHREKKDDNKSNSSQSSLAPLPDHTAPEQARNPRFKFDFYVITAEESTPWVQYSLLPGMECNFFSFKGYYHQRDTALGRLRIKSQAQPIKDSARVLTVLTRSFTESAACQHLLEIAREHKLPEQMAVLLRDDTSVPDEICSLKTFNFCGLPSSVANFEWFDLAKFMLRKVPG